MALDSGPSHGSASAATTSGELRSQNRMVEASALVSRLAALAPQPAACQMARVTVIVRLLHPAARFCIAVFSPLLTVSRQRIFTATYSRR